MRRMLAGEDSEWVLSGTDSDGGLSGTASIKSVVRDGQSAAVVTYGALSQSSRICKKL